MNCMWKKVGKRMELEGIRTTSRTQLGGSLPVPNVQALAAAVAAAASNNTLTATTIPERYIRPEIETDVVHDTAGDEIPVIDLSRLTDDQFSREEAAKLKLACEDWGFFQLTKHGVPDEVVEEMKVAVEEFFGQPLEEKMASSKQRAGSAEGYGQAFVVWEDQKLDWADMLYLYTQPPHLRNATLWPTHPPSFGATLEKYSLELKRVADRVLGQIAKNLGLVPEKLTDIFKEGMQSMRMNYYPPCSHHADKVLGLSPHSDADGLTLLLQVNQVQGLQIKRNGEWIPVKPIPGAFIVNIGDILEILSNGRCKSIEHRAMINKEKERLSIAAFLSLDVDGMVGPLPDLVEGGEPSYKTLSTEEYYRQFYSKKLQGKSFLDYMKLKK